MGGGLNMGAYLNLGNSGFARIIRSDYVDKTDLYFANRKGECS